VRALWQWLPKGNTIPDAAWRQRHRAILILLWAQAVGLAIFGAAAGYEWQHSLAEAALVAACGLPATATRLNRRIRSAAATLGLVSASALLVHLTNGLTEAHFHFFVMLAVVAIYQDWVPFLLGIGFVVLEHGTVGVLLPDQVYDHAAAWNEPWLWAAIHGVFVVGLCTANVVQWRFAEITLAERRRASETQSRLAAIVTSSDDAIMSTDLAGNVTSWNAGAERMFGYAADDILGHPLTDLIPDDHASVVAELSRRMRSGEIPYQTELTNRRRDGSLLDVSVTISPIPDATGVLIGYACIARDISARKETEKAILHQAAHDGLTGLPNRIRLGECLTEAVAKVQREGGSAALLVLDLNRFKEVNDTFGHQDGDELLQEVAHRLASQRRCSETVSRLGGDEFALLLPSATTEDALRRADELHQVLSAAFELQGFSVETGASIGVVLAPEHGSDADTLLRRADVAMYVAKQAGGGSALYSDEHDQHSPARLALVGQLRHAIEHNELTLYYQPKVESRDGEVIGVEALVRWAHPEHGFVMPDQFISLAEQSGLIGPLTKWVIGEALRQGRAWRDDGVVLPVAVNLSMRNLHDRQLAEHVQSALEQYDLPPDALELELTESSLMADPARAMAVLSQLSAMGLRMAVDDFGTGYSSLSYLKNLPVHELKVDRSFVRDMTGEPRDRAIVQSTIDLAHHLGLRVVAEGVEDAATWELLRRLGCDIAQGYYLSRPIPAGQLREWLANRPRLSESDPLPLAA
jgi:diguanylate cyclase (GGDEF)-like protein/PAS domain S-box-containing protein